MPLHPLNRSTWTARCGAGATRPPAPVRIVHLGLGAFHRAHQAWYTDRAADASDWGIAAFTGRSPRLAELLAAQDGLYTLVERGPQTDRVDVVSSIVEARRGADVERLVDLLAAPDVAVVTLTITEAGYRATPQGRPDLQDPVVAGDLDVLRAAVAGHHRATDGRPAAPVSALGRLLLGLDARRRSGAGPVTVLPCDNIPGNGAVTRGLLLSLAEDVAGDLRAWVEAEVSFASSAVDRITPRVDDPDIAAVRAAGWRDAAPVVTEPFSEWVIQGDFPAGRPDWASAGVRFVPDVEPFERRKLWLLNGAHSTLAWSGMVRGHVSVADAIGDPVCRGLVERFWSEAVDHLPDDLETVSYRESLLERFANPRIVHRLDQVAVDSATKVRHRITPVAIRSLDAGAAGAGSVSALATWISWTLSRPDAPDSRSDEIAAALNGPEPVTRLLAMASPRLAGDPRLVSEVRDALSSGSALYPERVRRGEP